MKRIIPFLLLFLTMPFQPVAHAADLQDCQKKCYKRYASCAKKATKNGDKLLKICKEDRRCKEEARFDANKGRVLCKKDREECLKQCYEEKKREK